VLAAATVSEDEAEAVSSVGALAVSAELPAEAVSDDAADDADEAEDALLPPHPAIIVPASAAAQRADTIFAFILLNSPFLDGNLFPASAFSTFRTAYKDSRIYKFFLLTGKNL
jgi:hypothetical protein